MSVVYLCSPYSHPDRAVLEQRFEAACRGAAQVMREGHHVFSPIAHSHPIAVHGDIGLLDLHFWLEQDRAFLGACDEVRVLMLDGWRDSIGIRREIEWAADLGIPVTYMEAK